MADLMHNTYKYQACSSFDMRILLLNPPPIKLGAFVKDGRCQTRGGGELWPPFTLGIIASLLRENDFDFVFLDATAEKLTVDRFKRFIGTINFDVVLINSTTVTFFDDLAVAKIIKEKDKNIVTIFYGTHVTALPDDALSYREIDYVIRKEPELTVLKLFKALKEGKNVNNINGVSYRINGKKLHNPDINFDYHLDTLPFPALDLFPNEKYLMPHNNEKITVLRSSRGCPFHCIYCTSRLYYGCKWRTRSVDNVLDEIERDVNLFKIKNFHFNSDTFNLDKKWVFDFAKGIKQRNLDIHWVANSRVDTLDCKSLKVMKNSGCWLISFGTESGDQTILNNSKKGITLKQSLNAVKLATSVGIETLCYFMFGLPGETKQSVTRTIQFSEKLNPTYVRFYKAVPYPGTEFYKTADKNGLIKSKDWSLYDMADCDIYEFHGPSSKELMREIKKAYFSFYLRPSYALQQFKKRGFSDILTTALNGIVFLKKWLK